MAVKTIHTCWPMSYGKINSDSWIWTLCKHEINNILTTLCIQLFMPSYHNDNATNDSIVISQTSKIWAAVIIFLIMFFLILGKIFREFLLKILFSSALTVDRKPFSFWWDIYVWTTLLSCTIDFNYSMLVYKLCLKFVEVINIYIKWRHPFENIDWIVDWNF